MTFTTPTDIPVTSGQISSDPNAFGRDMSDVVQSRSERMRAARVALILIPLFIIGVLFFAVSGMGNAAKVAQENAKPTPTAAQPVDQELIDTVTAALPDDMDADTRAEILGNLGQEPETEAATPADMPGGPLAPLMNLFLLLSLIVIIAGSIILLSSRRRKWAARTFAIALPLLIVSGIATSGFAWVAFAEEAEEKKRPFNVLAVMAAKALTQDVQLSVRTQGETQPRVEIDLVPEVGGKIVYVSPNFLDGGIFSRGETLVRIDPSDYQTQLISAEASLANAQQALAREVAEGEIARGDIQELGIANPTALALRTPQRQQAQAAVRAAEAEVQRARTQLGRANVRAPFAGRVRSKSADVGQFVAPGTRLGRIFASDAIEVRLPLTDTDLAKLDLPIAYVAKDRDTAPKVVLSAKVGGVRREWDAVIMRTDASYDTQTRALFAIAEVADPFGTETGTPLAPGLFVDAVIEGLSLEDVVVLPRDGLRAGNEVYVVDMEGKADARTVEVIETTPDRAVLRPGVVSAGELVVVSPLEPSRLGTPLKVLDVNDPTTVIVEPKRPGPPDADGSVATPTATTN